MTRRRGLTADGIAWAAPRKTRVGSALTEAGAAESFCAARGDDLRYDHRRGRWLVWQGHRFIADADGAVTRLALKHVREQQHHALDIPDGVERQKQTEHWAKFDRRAALDNMLAIAKALPPVADAGDRWDADRYVLGVSNGVVDLQSGALRPGRREDGVIMSAGVPFDPMATCPRWTQFLTEIFAGDEELVGFVQRAVGYSLLGLTSEQCLFVLYGTGANGKSTFVITVKFVLGDYAWNMPFSTIELRNRAAIPNDLAALVGRRFVIASETNDGTRLNEGRVKALTGCDPVTARFLHQEFFTFEPVAKFWLSVNHKPVVRDDSHGFWRRIRLIPFTRRFAPHLGLLNELRHEAPGVLAWAVRGCLDWQRRGLQPPAVVTAATAQYECESDPLADFIDEAIDREPDSVVTGSDLYQHYKVWADRHGLNELERLSATAFGSKAGERFERVRSSRGQLYRGITRRSM